MEVWVREVIAAGAQANATVPGADPAALLSGLAALENELQGTMGALLLGSFLGTVLYGLGLHQAYRYVRLYPSDQITIRLLIVTLLLLETLQVVFAIHTTYNALVTNYFNPIALTKSIWSANLITITGGLIIFIAEIFFIFRVSLIGFKYKIVAVVAFLFLSTKLGCDIALSVKGFQSGQITTYTDDTKLSVTPLASIFVVNVLLTVSLFVALRKARADYNRQDSLVDLVLMYVVNTGFLLLVFDLVGLILGAALPHDLYWVLIHLIVARLYMNTLLCVLNSRKILVSCGMEIFDAGSFGRNIIARANRIATAERWNVPQAPHTQISRVLDIKVTTEVEGEGGEVAYPPARWRPDDDLSKQSGYNA